MATKPQEIQFGSQPPKPAVVQFGKHPATTETFATSPGDSEPSHDAESGIVPAYAGGDPVPDA